MNEDFIEIYEEFMDSEGLLPEDEGGEEWFRKIDKLIGFTCKKGGENV
jgi:hypothetical protein